MTARLVSARLVWSSNRLTRGWGVVGAQLGENPGHAYLDRFPDMTEPTTESFPEPAAALPPSPEGLAADLAAMLRTGVTVERCRSAEALLGLALVQAKAASDTVDDRAVSAHNLIREACAAVDGIDTGGIAILLGVMPRWRGRLLKDRREVAAARLNYSVEHLRKDREPLLLEAVADELYAMDSAYRLRHRHRMEAEREPVDSRLKIDWYEQHRRYGRIWTPIVALRADLLVLVDWLRDIRSVAARAPGELVVDTDAMPADADPVAFAAAAEERGVVCGIRVDREWWRHCNERCAQMTWRLAQHSRELVAFVERDGGLFLMADAESEVRAVDALYRVTIYLPFGDRDVSTMRRILGEVPQQELDVFMERLLDDAESWAPTFAKWLNWAAALLDSGDIAAERDEASLTLMAEQEQGVQLTITPAAASEPVSTCGKWLAAAEELITLVETDWFRVADWYRGGRGP